ncbi:hypothetical protein [Ottowia testudinis]|uniref:Uncharacterized protein n=1 Tax=Ottowia testudinis TaxID=2816950 RepID=A0A975H318_9BURK|nr:hypothetical protein [Ottowia testudinis]QTD45438.1 hypothetical protein J1M35_00455 [Ottowia testudinis]
MATGRFFQSPAFRIAWWSGLSAGPVLALAWPVFVRLESGVWPASMLALTLAMLTLGTLVGLAAAFTLMLPVLSFINLQTGRRTQAVATIVGGLICLILVSLFGLFSDVERLGAQWPLGLLLTIAGAVCGYLGSWAVRGAATSSRNG